MHHLDRTYTLAFSILVTARIGLVNDETHRLALLNVVKANDSNVAVGILGTAFANFIENFLCRVCAKQRQFPHRPEVGIGFWAFFKLNARNKTLIQQILHLLDDLLVGHRW